MNELIIKEHFPLPDNFNNKEINISYWAGLYYQTHVLHSPTHTQRSKKLDLTKFLNFFHKMLDSSEVNLWTPAITKAFQKHLSSSKSETTDSLYQATSINRTMATIRHFAKWLESQHPLPTGYPFHGVKDIMTDQPIWNGLSDKEILKLKSACSIRLKACDRRDQNPILEIAVFYVLLLTGIRESELAALNMDQYYNRGFHNVKRKGKKVTKKVPVPQEARDMLDTYLSQRNPQSSEEPLFISRYGNRLSVRDIHRICKRIANQASVNLSTNDKVRLSPHMLRHTFLKRAADKHGVHFAQQLSGNVSIKEIFRYTKPSQDEIDQSVENLM